MSNTGNSTPEGGISLPPSESSPISLLEKVRSEGRAWQELADQYGVTNPDPPWKVFLEGTCEALNAEACALPLLERRWAEDELSETLYQDVPQPERQLLTLAHTMIRRGLVDEQELSRRMGEVRRRLTAL